MKLFNHPFYLRSFIALLFIDVSYTVIAYLITPEHYHFGRAELISLIWFVCFYLLPVWLAASIIFKLREQGRSHFVIEISLVVSFMVIGNYLVDIILSDFLNYMASMGHFVILNGMMWGSILYFSLMFFENKKRVQTEKRAKKQAQLQTLRYQLNPHFMFNSLNTISAYIHTKPDVADQVLHNLADVLRYSLDTAEKETVSLAQELKMIATYLAIEATRFGDRLTFNQNIENSVLAQPIPPLLLQPIIENTIKHCSTQKTVVINLDVALRDNKLIIKVEDNGKGFSPEVLKHKRGKGIGLKNIVERVAQLPNSTLVLSNTPGACIEMELSL